MQLKDIYWLAGLMEGEGCFSLWNRSGGRNAVPQINLNMCDEDVVVHAAKIFDVPCYGPYQNGRRADGNPKQPIYAVRVQGSHALAWMMTLYSLMGTRRRGKLKELIGFGKTKLALRKRKRIAKFERRLPKGLPAPC